VPRSKTYSFKPGKLSVSDMEFIRENASRMSVEEIAEHLNRTTEPISKFIKSRNLLSVSEVDNLDVVYEDLYTKLQRKFYYDELKKQLDDDELNYFTKMWVDIMMQFKEDVLSSEEHQIKQLILTEILVNRIMRKRKLVKNDIERLGKALDEEYKKPADKRNAEDMVMWEGNLALARTADGQLTGEQNKLNVDLKNLYKDLKATRDQRFSKVESGERTFTTLIKELYEQQTREQEGRATELIRLATEQKKKDLQEEHVFVDGIVDLPLLTPEAVLEREQNEKSSIQDQQEEANPE
jgi:flagellar biosynthesis regulator FlbT